MSVAAPEARVLLPGQLDLLTPYGPDPVVFGAPRPWLSPAEAEALTCAAGMSVAYRCCQVRGTGLRCWCCGQYGQVAPEPRRTVSADPLQVVTTRGEPAASTI